LFDKWGLPIKKKGIEQPESIEQECLKPQHWSQNTLNLYFPVDPFFTYDPTPSIQCCQVNGLRISEALVHHNQEVIQPDPVPEKHLPPSPISSNPITNPLSSRSTPYLTPLGSPTTQGFKEDLWDLH
jgi:hypothetical protein